MNLRFAHRLPPKPVLSYPARLMLRSTFNRRAVRSAALVLIPILLFAQGLRLCLHAHEGLWHATDHSHASLVHLESTLSTTADHEESTAAVDVPLAALLKVINSALAFAAVFAIVFLAFAPRARAWRLPPAGFWLRASVVHRFTPPLRAPPR